MGARLLSTALASGILLLGLAGCETHKKGQSGKRDPNVGASSAKRSKTASNQAPSNSKARIKFEELEHDLGTVTDSEPIAHSFKFKNVGTETLVIEKVGSS